VKSSIPTRRLWASSSFCSFVSACITLWVYLKLTRTYFAEYLLCLIQASTGHRIDTPLVGTFSSTFLPRLEWCVMVVLFNYFLHIF